MNQRTKFRSNRRRKNLLPALEAEITRNRAAWKAAQQLSPLLAKTEDPHDVLSALSSGSVSTNDKAALVFELVGAYQSTRNSACAALLLAGFRPLCVRMDDRFKDSDVEDEDRAQITRASLLDSAAAVPLSKGPRWVLYELSKGADNRVRNAARAQEREDEAMVRSLDLDRLQEGEPQAQPLDGLTPADMALIVRRIEPKDWPLVRDTILSGESVPEFTKRNHPQATARELAKLQLQFAGERSRLLKLLRELFL